MKNTFFLLLALWGATLYAQPAQLLLDKATTLSEKGHYTESNTYLTTLIDQHPTRKYDLSEAEFLISENHLALANLVYAKRANDASLILRQSVIPEEVGKNLLQAGIIALAAAQYEEAIELLDQAEDYPFMDAPATPAEIKFLKGIIYQKMMMTEESVDALQEGLAIQEIIGDINKARSKEEFEAVLRLKPEGDGQLNSMEIAACTNWYLLSKITYGKAEALNKAYATNQDIEALKEAHQLMLTSIDAFEQYSIYLSPSSQHKYLIEESKAIYDLGIGLCLLLNEQDNKEEYTLRALELAERAKWFQSELATIKETNLLNDKEAIEKELEYKAQYNAAVNKLALEPKNSNLEVLVLKERKTYIDYLNSKKIQVPQQNISDHLIKAVEQFNRKEGALYYYIGIEAAYVAIMSKSSLALETIIEPLSLKKDISTYTTLAEGEEKTQYACQLYDQLITPVAKAIRSKKMLLIYPNEKLIDLPFENILQGCASEKKHKGFKHLSIQVVNL